MKETNNVENSIMQCREDLRGEWYREWDSYSAFVYRPPKIYWLGMFLSGVWLVAYLFIYPSIPLVFSNSHWKGVGMPGGCQPWTSICEMQNSENKLKEIRGRYIDVINTASVSELASNSDMTEFTRRAGKVLFEDNCAGCHGRNGAGVADLHAFSPILNDQFWGHGQDVQSIKDSILSPSIHSFGLSERTNETNAKILAIYVGMLAKSASIHDD
jgi:cytochrome c oxidase cbb3-type subunit 3